MPVKRLSLALFLLITVNCFAQEDVPDYLRKPTLPPFTLLGVDSVKITEADIPPARKILIMLFSPDCDYCKAQTSDLVKNMSSLKDVEIIMISFDPLPMLAAFSKGLDLGKYNNVKVARDVRYFFTPYYEPTGVPFLALYNEERKLVTTFNSIVTIEKLLKAYSK